MLPPIAVDFVAPRGQIYRAEGRGTLPRGAAGWLHYEHSLRATCIAATIRVLQKNGCEVLLPPDQGCCGALHVHGGDMDGGRELARRNIAAFEGLGAGRDHRQRGRLRSDAEGVRPPTSRRPGLG